MGTASCRLCSRNRHLRAAQELDALLPPAQAKELLASALAGKAQVAMAQREWDAAEELLTQARRGTALATSVRVRAALPGACSKGSRNESRLFGCSSQHVSEHVKSDTVA